MPSSRCVILMLGFSWALLQHSSDHVFVITLGALRWPGMSLYLLPALCDRLPGPHTDMTTLDK